jgi:hypothetical protein
MPSTENEFETQVNRFRYLMYFTTYVVKFLLRKATKILLQHNTYSTIGSWMWELGFCWMWSAENRSSINESIYAIQLNSCTNSVLKIVLPRKLPQKGARLTGMLENTIPAVCAKFKAKKLECECHEYFLRGRYNWPGTTNLTYWQRYWQYWSFWSPSGTCA